MVSRGCLLLNNRWQQEPENCEQRFKNPEIPPHYAVTFVSSLTKVIFFRPAPYVPL